MPLPVQPALPGPGPYGTQTNDALAATLTTATPVKVGFPDDITLWATLPQTAAILVEGSQNNSTWVKLGEIPVGASVLRLGRVGYRWLKVTGTIAGVLKIGPAEYMPPGTTLAAGVRGIEEEEEDAHAQAVAEVVEDYEPPEFTSIEQVPGDEAAELRSALAPFRDEQQAAANPGEDVVAAPKEEEENDYTREELEAMTNSDLQEILSAQGKSTSGTKSELVDRVLA